LGQTESKDLWLFCNEFLIRHMSGETKESGASAGAPTLRSGAPRTASLRDLPSLSFRYSLLQEGRRPACPGRLPGGLF
jgi:hypothetical protein